MMFTGLFVWAFLSLVHNRNLGLVLVVLIYGTAFALYHLIPQQHPLCVLRYFNLWFLASPKETFLEYVNFRIGGILVNLREFVQGTAFVLPQGLLPVILIRGRDRFMRQELWSVYWSG